MKIAIVMLTTFAMIEAVIIVWLFFEVADASRQIGAERGRAWGWQKKCEVSHILQDPCMWTP
ncbi:MAG: hypothetical protein WC563_15625 [Brevundimonas sp.]